MDRKTKIQLLLDMQENPEQYSEEELKTMRYWSLKCHLSLL